jgi:hypothetical protein
MAYKFDLETEFDEIFIDRDGTRVVDIALGYDLDQDKVVLMSVMLVSGDSFLRGELQGVYDLQFGIRERKLVDEETVTPPDFSTASAEKYIPKEFRSAVFGVLLKAVQKLLLELKPPYLTMETYYGHLPAKALRKYEEINRHIASFGYRVMDHFRDGTTGVDYWFFRRNS